MSVQIVYGGKGMVAFRREICTWTGGLLYEDGGKGGHPSKFPFADNEGPAIAPFKWIQTYLHIYQQTSAAS